MGFLGTALTIGTANRTGLAPYFFSRFNFTRMRENKNTHFCFFCGGMSGFRPTRTGKLVKRNDVSKPTNHLDGGYDYMAKHDASHERAVIGNANKYSNVWDWLEREIKKKKDFPFVVSVPSVD